MEIDLNNLLKRGIIPIPTTGSDTDTLSAGKRETKSPNSGHASYSLEK